MPHSAFEQAKTCLPPRLREQMDYLPAQVREKAEEVRLRAGHIPAISLEGEERPIAGAAVVSEADLATVLELASRHSVHSALDRMRNGFLTIKGGHRLGLAGAVTMEGGKVVGFRSLNSVNLRIAREIRGAAAEIAPRLFLNGKLQSTLIVAPPGTGKTTLLRDLIRTVSQGNGVPALRVGVVDDRGELAALWGGMPQLNLGCRTDILDGIPKAEGMLFLLRGMNPQVLATDEITHPEDVEAIRQVAGCGVPVLATAHGSCVRDLMIRPVYRALLQGNVFRQAVVLRREKSGKREGKVEELSCCDWQEQPCCSPLPPHLV